MYAKKRLTEVFNFREKILVNRGWVPKTRMSPDARKDGQVII